MAFVKCFKIIASYFLKKIYMKKKTYNRNTFYNYVGQKVTYLDHTVDQGIERMALAKIFQ